MEPPSGPQRPHSPQNHSSKPSSRRSSPSSGPDPPPHASSNQPRSAAMDDDDVLLDVSPSLAHLGVHPRISTPTPTPPRCRTSPDLTPWTSTTCHPTPPRRWRTTWPRSRWIRRGGGGATTRGGVRHGARPRRPPPPDLFPHRRPARPPEGPQHPFPSPDPIVSARSGRH